MSDAYDEGLFDEPVDVLSGDALPDALPEVERFTQDGPDLFGAEPDELILPEPPAPAEPGGQPMGAEELAITDTGDDAEDLEAEDRADDVAAASSVPEEPAGDEPSGTPRSTRGTSGRLEGSRRADAPLALYRRYRPETFAEVIGQEHVTEPLQRALENNRVSHAYLFSGPRGCGKTTSARILARCLNCEQGPTPTPCGVCRSCRDLARGGAGSIDVIEIDAASHGGVDEARDLRERAFFAPVASRYKIYIIDEAHMVTTQGFNALLKVVEEPPPHVKFVFATTEPDKVIGTIRSRTHHYPFRLVPPKTLTGYLAQLCESEGARVDHAVLPLVVRAGAGSVRDSLSVLDQLLGGSGPDGVEYAHAARLLGYTPDSLLDEIMDAFAAGDAAGVFACVDKVIEVGQDPRRFAEDLLRRLRDLILVAAVPDALVSGLVDVAEDQAERLTTQASGMGPGELTRAAEVIAKGLTEMRGTTAPRLHLELMCSRVLLPGADADGRGVHARLDRLERRLAISADAAAAAEPAGPVGYPGPSAPAEVTATPPTTRPSATPPTPAAAAPPPAPGAAPPPAPEAHRPPPPAAAPAPPASAPTDPSVVGTAQVRAMWPQVLDEVKNRRRVTWIILREQAQVHDFADGVLTLAMNNPGARESFSRGGSPDILREAVLEVLGVAARIETLALDDDPGSRAPSPPAASEPSPPRPAPDGPSPAQRAKQNIQATQLTPTETEDEEGSRDDVDLDAERLDTNELMTKYLGAELLGEEEPDA